MQSEFTKFKKGKAIALVEDDADMRALLQDFLAISGFAVHAYSGVQEFLQEFARRQREYVLLLSDVQLPDGNGLRLAGEVRRKRRDLPIFLMTASPSLIDEQRAQLLGVGVYLHKPFRMSELLESIHTATSRVPA